MLVILDEDLLEYLDYHDEGMAQMFGNWFNWLVQELKTIINAHRAQLPVKAHKINEPCVYWSLLPLHSNFSETKNNNRRKLNFCMESTLKGRSDMHVIKIKDIWNSHDKSLVKNDNFTETGFYTYWRAIDAALKFNVLCHEMFLACMQCH